MAYTAHYTLFNRPGVRSRTQHFDVVIRLHHQHVAPAEMVAHTHRHIPEVGGEAYLDSFRPESEAYWIRRVVWNCKWRDFDIADSKTATRGKMLRLRQLRNFAFLIAHGTIPGVVVTLREVHRHI